MICADFDTEIDREPTPYIDAETEFPILFVINMIIFSLFATYADQEIVLTERSNTIG